jgi:hypothetical protein
VTAMKKLLVAVTLVAATAVSMTACDPLPVPVECQQGHPNYYDPATKTRKDCPTATPKDR